MKSFCWELMFWSSKDELNIVNFFLEKSLNDVYAIFKKSSFKLISIVSELGFNFFHGIIW